MTNIHSHSTQQNRKFSSQQFILIFNSKSQIDYVTDDFDPILLKTVLSRIQPDNNRHSFPDFFRENLQEVIDFGRNRQGNITIVNHLCSCSYAYVLMPDHCPVLHLPTVTAIFTLTGSMLNDPQKIFLMHFQDIFESYHYPVCLVHRDFGSVIISNGIYSEKFYSAAQDHNRVHCWNTFQEYRKVFHLARDWHSIPFCSKDISGSTASGLFSVGELTIGDEKALIFTFSLHNDGASDRYYDTADIIQSLRMEYSHLVGNLGHEVGNVLTVLSGNLQLMAEQNAFQNFPEEYRGLQMELQRSIQITQDLRSLSQRSARRIPIHLEDVLASMQHILKHLAKHHRVHVVFNFETALPILADENEIRQVLLNLFKNAYESMENGGTIAIGIFTTPSEVVLSIQDQGPGIPSHIVEKIGTPYLTTKKTGTGLGLNICYEKVRANGGRIEFDTGPDGTCFRVIFPLHYEIASNLINYGSDPL